MQLQTWVKEKGGLKEAARILKVSRPRLAAWCRKEAVPRPVLMRTIVKASNGRVSYKEIIDSTLPVSK